MGAIRFLRRGVFAGGRQSAAAGTAGGMPMDQRSSRVPRRESGAAINRRVMVRGLTGLGLAATGGVGWLALRNAIEAAPYSGTPEASPIASRVASPVASPM